MKKKLKFSMLFAAILTATTLQARAAVIDFEDLTTQPSATIPSGYEGFDWNGASVGNRNVFTGMPGYVQGTSSGAYAIYTGNTTYIPLTITSLTGPFDVAGLYVSAAYATAEQAVSVKIEAYAEYAKIFSEIFSGIHTNGTTLELDLTGVKTLVVWPVDSGGLIVDDIRYSVATAVPGPIAGAGIPALLLGGLALLKRRRDALRTAY